MEFLLARWSFPVVIFFRSFFFLFTPQPFRKRSRYSYSDPFIVTFNVARRVYHPIRHQLLFFFDFLRLTSLKQHTHTHTIKKAQRATLRVRISFLKNATSCESCFVTEAEINEIGYSAWDKGKTVPYSIPHFVIGVIALCRSRVRE